MGLNDSQHLRPELIAAYLAQEASADERQAVQRHLLTCRDCRRDVAEASELGTGRKRRRWIAVSIPAAAAAAVAVAILVPAERAGVDSSDRPVMRREQAVGIKLFAAVTPAEGAAVGSDTLVFRWRSEGSGTHYLLTLTDANGDVVWTEGTSDTTLVLPRDVGLKSGGRYFWYVDALLEGARSSTTGVLEFQVRP